MSDPGTVPTDARYRRRIAFWTLVALSAVPALSMLDFILAGSPLQHNDYWAMIDRLLADDGGIRPLQVFTFNNEHPLAIGQMLFVLNLWVFDGSNLSQGIVVVAIGGAQAFVVWRMARTTFGPRSIAAASIALAGSALVFAPRGAWVYLKSMSGAGWLPANLFALIAIHFADRCRRGPAFAAAVLASISYGTGFLAWPAIALTSMVRRRRWTPPVETVIGFAVSAVWLASRPTATSDESAAEFGISTWSKVKVFLTLVGYLVPGGTTGWQWLGVVLVLGGAVAAGVLIRRGPDVAPYAGTFAYSFGALFLIARGRSLIVLAFGLPSRYANLTGLLWLSCFAMVALLARPGPGSRPDRWRSPAVAIGAAVVATLVLLGGQDETRRLEANLFAQNRLEIAIRFGLADDSRELSLLSGTPFPDLSERLELAGHYPFGHRSFSCGLADTTIDRPGDDAPAFGQATFLDESRLNDAVRARVDLPATTDAPAVDCVVAIDADGVVVGAGYLEEDQPDVGRRYMTIAKDTAVEILVVTEDGSLRRVETLESEILEDDS